MITFIDLIKSAILQLPKRIDSNGCWNYLGTINDSGYGILDLKILGGTKLKLHRIVMSIHVDFDLADENILICHKCNNRACFNYDHLYIGTYTSNAEDRINSKGYKTHCKFGHLIDKVTLIRSGPRKGTKSRFCSVCHKKAQDKYAKNKK